MASTVQLTVSIGIYTTSGAFNPDAALQFADLALYEAKKTRDCVVQSRK